MEMSRSSLPPKIMSFGLVRTEIWVDVHGPCAHQGPLRLSMVCAVVWGSLVVWEPWYHWEPNWPEYPVPPPVIMVMFWSRLMLKAIHGRIVAIVCVNVHGPRYHQRPYSCPLSVLSPETMVTSRSFGSVVLLLLVSILITESWVALRATQMSMGEAALRMSGSKVAPRVMGSSLSQSLCLYPWSVFHHSLHSPSVLSTEAMLISQHHT